MAAPGTCVAASIQAQQEPTRPPLLPTDPRLKSTEPPTHPGWGRPPPSRGRCPSASSRSSAARWPSGPPGRQVPNQPGHKTWTQHATPPVRPVPGQPREPRGPCPRAEDTGDSHGAPPVPSTEPCDSDHLRRQVQGGRRRGHVQGSPGKSAEDFRGHGEGAPSPPPPVGCFPRCSSPKPPHGDPQTPAPDTGPAEPTCCSKEASLCSAEPACFSRSISSRASTLSSLEEAPLSPRPAHRRGGAPLTRQPALSALTPAFKRV